MNGQYGHKVWEGKVVQKPNNSYQLNCGCQTFAWSKQSVISDPEFSWHVVRRMPHRLGLSSSDVNSERSRNTGWEDSKKLVADASSVAWVCGGQMAISIARGRTDVRWVCTGLQFTYQTRLVPKLKCS